MKVNLTSKEFDLFKDYIRKHCGIEIGDQKAYLIESRLAKLLVEYEVSSYEELYYKIYRNTNPKIKEQVIDAITTNETLWFRDKTPWVILEEKLMPKYIELLRSKKRHKIRIWSAASSTGQEAYSTAMSINEYLEKNNIKDINLSQFEILATDISKPVLNVAKKGRYDSVSIMRGLDNKYKMKYFKNEGRTWVLDDKIKSLVTFRKFNLQDSFWSLGKFDIIFLRYVLIYFSSDFKSEALKKIKNTLNENGKLFLGSSEILHDQKNEFNNCNYKNGVYYSVGEC